MDFAGKNKNGHKNKDRPRSGSFVRDDVMNLRVMIRLRLSPFHHTTPFSMYLLKQKTKIVSKLEVDIFIHNNIYLIVNANPM